MVGEALARGYSALDAGRWAEAKAVSEAAPAETETAEGSFGLAAALWWLGENHACVEVRAEPGGHLDCGAHRRRHLVLDLDVHERGTERHLQPATPSTRWSRNGPFGRGRADQSRVGPAQDVQHQRGVIDRPGHRAGVREGAERAGRVERA